MVRSEPMNAAVLLVEDDPVTAAYLQAASQQVIAQVDVANSMAAAMVLAAQRAHAAWLIDANLPDGRGAALLARLRAQGLQAVALAHTASSDQATASQLLQAGFAKVVTKPISHAGWQRALRELLGTESAKARMATLEPADQAGWAAVWDDSAANRAMGGRSDHVRALRQLFVEELPKQREAIRVGDAEVRRQQLHRLQASCRLVGAAQLDAAAACLHASPDDADALARFLRSADLTLAQMPG